MEKTWKPLTGGILSIIAGALGILRGMVILVVGGAIAGIEKIAPLVPEILAAVAIPMIILGIVAIIGGIYALKRKMWGLALAGSICSLVSVLGIPAIIFVAMGKDEFE